MSDTEPTAPNMALMIMRAKRTTKIHDAFLHRWCFPHYKTIDPNIEGEKVAAEYIWIGSAPAFLPVLFCGAHYRLFLANSYTDEDAHNWPTFHARIDGGGH